jgi:hypothetical protein
MRRLLAIALVASSIAVSTELRAAPCTLGVSPFTDVPLNAIFCGDALWLRNAGVTIGCGTGTTYCPDDSVTRAQMALFMNRLANTLTQDTIVVSPLGFTGDLDSGGVITCLSPQYVVPANRTRRLFSNALASVTIVTNGPAGAFATMEMNTDGGPFQAVGNVLIEMPGNQRTQISVLGGGGVSGGSGVRLTPGSTYQWRVRFARQGGTTGDVTDVQCQLKIELPVDPVP